MGVPADQGFAYGLVQGLTEVLPISSSAHLILLPWFFGWRDPGLGFDVALHAGTLLAILWYFWRDWFGILGALLQSLSRGSLADNDGARIFWKLLVASLPGALAGLALADYAESTFRSPLLVAATLSGFGVLLYIGDRRPNAGGGLGAIGWRESLLIGVAQAFAIVPGVSRSGVTITAARLLEIDREAAARFSFLLATPIVAGATLVKAGAFAEVLGDPGQMIALLASTVFGFVAIAVLLRYVRTRTYAPFVIYRLLLAVLIVAVAAG